MTALQCTHNSPWNISFSLVGASHARAGQWSNSPKKWAACSCKACSSPNIILRTPYIVALRPPTGPSIVSCRHLAPHLLFRPAERTQDL